MELVNLIRERVKAWREAGYPRVTRTTEELLNWWRRDGRQFPLFFAQREAAETVIFLNEARADFRQGLEVPRDDPSAEKKAQGYSGFIRYACKMATGSGKTTVMGMLAAWSILNKVNDRSDARFSDVVFVVCPNITIRDRLQELDPKRGAASLYRSRDLVPDAQMSKLSEGFVVVTNWHVLEPQEGNQVGCVGAAVVKRGPENDTAVVARVLGREVGGKQNVLVMNDEAHHCYRLVQERPDEWEQMTGDEREDWLEENKEATVWIDGLDKIQKIRGINFCVDLSATPYYLNRTGNDANRPFPWVVTDFSLVDAIESGLVKIPQLAIRDTTGAEIPAYFNIWRWIMEPGRLTSAERGGSKAQPKPEAVLKWAHTPIAQLAFLWAEDFKDWQKDLEQHPTSPVFIIVCRNTRLAKVLYEWIADDNRPLGIPALGSDEFRNRNGQTNTIRVDSKVVHETDTEGAKSDEHRWMRFTLDTVGKTQRTLDSQGRPIYPTAFVELATKLDRPLHPPGRDVRCIVSVAMLTEGWDCTTVTHIIGLRPFMSQLLCEQVVGRGLRRTNYDPGDLIDGKFPEEVAKVYGVPFEVIPFKTNTNGPRPPPVKRWRIHAISPERDNLEIRFPRVEGYTYAVRNRISVDWDSFPPVVLDPNKIPPEVEVKGLNVNNRGRLSLSGPGKADLVKLQEFRAKHRVQELEFELARALTKDCLDTGQCKVPAQSLFPQLLQIVHRYLHEYVRVYPPNDLKDIFLSPYYGWVIEKLVQAIRPDTASGESPEVPRYEANRKPGSTRNVDLWTSREVREPTKSHLNYIVLDTKRWEQSAAFFLDTNANVFGFAKNSGLGFAVPYFHNGQMHDFVPDYLVRLTNNGTELGTLILEVKGFDERAEVKKAAAKRWCAAVNADGKFGRWHFEMVRNPAETTAAINRTVEVLVPEQS